MQHTFNADIAVLKDSVVDAIVSNGKKTELSCELLAPGSETGERSEHFALLLERGDERRRSLRVVLRDVVEDALEILECPRRKIGQSHDCYEARLAARPSSLANTSSPGMDVPESMPS